MFAFSCLASFDCFFLSAVGLAPTSANLPIPAPFGQATNFWGSPTMWGIFVGVLVTVMVSFGCYVIVRDRMRESRRYAFLFTSSDTIKVACGTLRSPTCGILSIHESLE